MYNKFCLLLLISYCGCAMPAEGPIVAWEEKIVAVDVPVDNSAAEPTFNLICFECDHEAFFPE
jgi:hypothetical protein